MMLPVYLTEFRQLPDVPPKTVNRMVQAALQQQQINPVSVPTLKRLPLTTVVKLASGIEAVVCGHSTCDCRSYRVCWFDRRFWMTRFKWVSRGDFEVLSLPDKQTAEAVSGSAVA